MATSAISIDIERMSGTACFTGTRVPIKTLFDFLTHDRNISTFLEEFPSVKREMVNALFDQYLDEIRDAELEVRSTSTASVALKCCLMSVSFRALDANSSVMMSILPGT